MANIGNTTDYNAFLEDVVEGLEYDNLVDFNSPLQAMIPIKEAEGHTHKKRIKYQNAGGASQDLQIAQNNARHAQAIETIIDLQKYYGVCRLDHMLVAGAKKQKGAVLDLFESGVRDTAGQVLQSISRGVFGDGSGKIGTVDYDGGDNGVTTTTLTLTNASDIVNFSVGDVLVFGITSATNVALEPGSLTVESIDRDGGSMVMSAIVNTVANAGVDQSIFLEGARKSATGADIRSMSGLARHIPATAPSSGESYFGADRSPDPVIMAGNIISATGKSYMGAFNEAARKIQMNGMYKLPNHAVMNPEDLQSFIEELLGAEIGLGNADKLLDRNGRALPGISSIEVMTTIGKIKVFGDRFCPKGYCWIADFAKQFELIGLDGLYHKTILENLPNDDALEIRLISYANMAWQNDCCPGSCAVITNLP